MKSIFKTLVLLSVIPCLNGCGNSSSNVISAENSITGNQASTEANTASTVADVSDTENNKSTASDENSGSNGDTSATDCRYDIDLTQMDSSMVYVQVADMVNNGNNYLGQTVKVKGPFSYFKENDGREFFAVLISDATACCSQGIEFVLDGNYKYPDDYPALNTEIVVTGEFNYYKEGYATYCQLLHANMEVDTSLSW